MNNSAMRYVRFARACIRLEPESEDIKIKIRGREGVCVLYIMRRTNRFGRLMEQHCDLEAVPMSHVRFVYKDHDINRNDTPISLGMQEGEWFDLYLLKHRNMGTEDQDTMDFEMLRQD